MTTDNKPLGITSPIPGISSEVDGAPATVPGSGGDGLTPQASTVKTTDTPSAGSPSAADNTDSASTDNEEQQKRDAVAGIDHQIKIYRDWLDTEANRPETKEEREKRERREKSKRIIAAVTDGIGVLSNLYFTSQYAPNMYNHDKGSMTKAVDARLEKMKAERERNDDKYLQFSLKLGDLENQRAATLRELEAQQEQLKLAREKNQREAEQHGWLALLQPDKQREAKGKADKAQTDAEWAERHNKDKHDLTTAKIKTEGTRQTANIASANNSNAGARDKENKEFYGLGADGKWHPFKLRQGAIDFEHRQHTYDPSRWGDDLEEITYTEETDDRDKTTRKTMRKSKGKSVKGKGYGDNDNKGY